MSIKDYTYKIPGGNVGVLLFHGLGGTPAEVRYVANGLARAGYTVHCPQLAGHGGDSDDLKATRWQDWYESAESALNEMSKTCDTIITGGLSTGAIVALMLAARKPDKVNGLTLFAPTLWLNGWSIPWYAHLFRLVHYRYFADLFTFPDLEPYGIKDPRIREFIYSSMSGEDTSTGIANWPGTAVLEHRRLVKAVKTHVPNIHQPAFIVHPREDDLAHLNNSWYLQRNLKGQVHMSVLDDSYHMVTVDRQRHTVVEQTQSFISRITEGERQEAEVTRLRSPDAVTA